MRLVVDARRRSARAAKGTILALTIVGAGVGLPGRSAHAQEGDWANAHIARDLAESTRERDERRRPRGGIERNAEDDELRPQRSAPIRRQSAQRNRKGVKVASLAPTPAPDPARQSSVAELPKADKKTADQERPRTPPGALGTMVASLGRDFMEPQPKELPSLFGGPIRWVAKSDCLVKTLQGVLAEVAAQFGGLQVNSTCRSPRHNRRVGGARRSFHLTGSAVDFRVASTPGPILAFLKGHRKVGGLKHYGRGLFHIDIGPRRSW